MSTRNWLQLLFGISTYIPGVYQWRSRRLGSGGTYSARYCYAVWMRHVCKIHENGLNPHPNTIAELGPGDSIGVGLASLLLGANRYFAFDVVEFASIKNNIEILDELVSLLKNREPIPDDIEFPRVQPFLDNYDFPLEIYPEEYLERVLTTERIERIRLSILNHNSKESIITYKVPWHSTLDNMQGKIDMIFSQATLEHVDELTTAYKSMGLWLNDGGIMSHSIDFKCHGYADTWDGHWAIPSLRWKLLRGKRPYMLNRAPYSSHMKLLRDGQNEIMATYRQEREPTVARTNLDGILSGFTEEDRRTSGAYILSRRQGMRN